MTVNQELMHVALSSLSLFRAPGSSPALIQAVGEVTGIPLFLLVNAEQRVVSSRSMLPLKRLLRDPSVPKAEGLQYSMKVRQVHLGRATPRERVQTRMTMAVSTVRGKIVINVTLTLQKAATFPLIQGQVARMAVCYRVESQTINQAYKQEMTIAATGGRARIVHSTPARAA